MRVSLLLLMLFLAVPAVGTAGGEEPQAPAPVATGQPLDEETMEILQLRDLLELLELLEDMDMIIRAEER